ncbi:MAG: hypothetical protein AAGA92_14940 [Planctomycetota bacterium]
MNKSTPLAVSVLLWAVIAAFCGRYFLASMPISDWRVVLALLSSPLVGMIIVYPCRWDLLGDRAYAFVVGTILQLSSGVLLLGFAIGVGGLVERFGLSWGLVSNLPTAVGTAIWVFMIAFWSILGVLVIVALFHRRWLMIRLGVGKPEGSPTNN